MAPAFGVFDPSPLIRHLELTLTPSFNLCPERDEPFQLVKVTDAVIASELGVTRRTVRRWRHGTRLTPRDADRYAVGVGLHPCLLWPEWYGDDAA